VTAEPLTRHSPLAHRAAAFEQLPAGITVRELPFLTQLNLRLDPAGAAARRVAEQLGAQLPSQPCTSLRAAGCELLWLGPDEWLLLTEAHLESQLRQAVEGEHAAITDVSAQRTLLSLTGPAARELLAKGCSIDFHPSVSPAGTCVQTLLAQTGIIIVVRDEQDYLLLVRQSFADYLAAWLIDAAGN
jgi:sarcosine oxidase, subunit gamma